MGPRTTLLPLATLVVGFSCGLAVSAIAGPGSFKRLAVFSKALSIIESRYIDEREPESLIYDAIGGLTQGLDDHSVFLDPSAYRELREVTRGEYSGIGVDVMRKDGALRIERVLPGSPAEEAGLQDGDVIVRVDDTQLAEVGASVLAELIRGDRGTQVLLGVLRPGVTDVLSFSVRRERIKTESVFVERLPRGVLKLRIARFQRDTYEEVLAALAAARSEGPGSVRGLILDLRDNPGGYLSEAVELANLWIDSGSLVSTMGRGAVGDADLATEKGTDLATPIAVIVDSGSASASEVLAGALRDHGRARVIGYPTYGKASVQQFFDLPDGSALKLTTARYLTPGGHRIHGSGITPDLGLGPRGASEPDIPLDDLPGYPLRSAAALKRAPEVAVALAWLEAPDRVDAWFGARKKARAE
jgi:carboxyl-terminal processing protease